MGRFAGLLLLFFSTLAPAQKVSPARSMYNRMMAAIENVKTCTFILNVDERIYDTYFHRQFLVKQQVKPHKVYVYSVKPDAGAEVLYLEGQNNGKVLINPNRFPFFNLNLLPSNPLLRKHHHYTIEQMGFTYVYEILRTYEAREKNIFYSKLHLDTIRDGKNILYYTLEIVNNEFGFINYKVMKGENVTDIARKFHINDQMILEVNREVNYFDDVRAGQVITIPGSFARRIVFHLDKHTLLPLTQIIYDHKGMYSKIEFSSFVLNPDIKPEEFTRTYPKYNF